MKKPLYIFSLLILLVVAFVAGNRFNQRGAGQGTASTGERQILHYVDPMDPTHITKEPGIAPCGMPMEPVYADDDTIRRFDRRRDADLSWSGQDQSAEAADHRRADR